MSRSGGVLGSVARGCVRSLVGLYYPKIEVANPERIPAQGPVLLAANHPNSVLDPVVIGIAARRPVRFLAKAPLFSVPVFGRVIRALGMLPAYRESDDPSQVGKNTETLGAGADLLVNGDALGIFPEGKTHDAPKVELVRSGAARIAMQAVEQGAKGLKIVPLGLNYEDKERFRSSVWVRVGEPIDATDWVQKHGGETRHAMRALTKELDRQLKDLAVHLNEPAWSHLLPDVETLMPPPAEAAAHPAAKVRQRKRIADAMNYFTAADRPRAERLAEDLSKHRETIARMGLEMRSPMLNLHGAALFARMLWEPFWLALLFLPALLGTLHHLLPFLLVRLIAPKLQTPGRTTVSFARLGLSVPLYGLWYAVSWWWWQAHWKVLPLFVNLWLAAMPFCGILALAYWPRALDASALWWHQLRLFMRSPELASMRQERWALRAAMQQMREEYARVFPPETALKGELPPPAPSRWGLRVAAALLLTAALGFSLYWRSRSQTIPELRVAGADLGKMPAELLQEHLAADDAALADILKGLNELDQKARTLVEEFESGKRSFYSQGDNDEIRRLMLAYLNYRTALLRVVWRYRNYQSVTQEPLRAHAFLNGYTAAASLWSHSLRFMVLFSESPMAVKKLNEAEPAWGIPPGVYDAIRANLARSENRELMEDALNVYRGQADAFRRSGLVTPEPYASFHAEIAQSLETSRALGRRVWEEKVAMTFGEAKGLGYDAYYKAQSLIATWIGDTKLREPREGRTLLDEAQLKELRSRLQPGDILLERRNWFLSNAFLPGYWPHAALYTGTAEDLKRLGLDTDPRVAAHFQEFARRDEHGHEHVIVEALSEGIVFASLEHSIGGGDSVAVLRPRLPPERIKEALCRGFSHAGKPYDFEFDFFSTDKIVCTELVYRAYDGDIHFELVDVMGRKTLPAIEMVRKYANERGTPGQQLDLIVFIDGDEETGTASMQDEEAFLGTLKRPGMTWLQPFSK
ncbi:MAG: 1-acyl-sn-glycerol-3-phosphate acyltransferase [Planctomycetota bacterium]|nr:1-acyl-sn-glycerol-3-phosphate acyltransferase [Planctomycetota bacterium]